MKYFEEISGIKSNLPQKSDKYGVKCIGRYHKKKSFTITKKSKTKKHIVSSTKRHKNNEKKATQKVMERILFMIFWPPIARRSLGQLMLCIEQITTVGRLD